MGTGAAATLDSVIAAPGLGWFTVTVFVLVSLFVGLRLGSRDMWGAFAVPPLVYIAAAGFASQLAPVADGNRLERTANDIATAVLGHPIGLLVGTGMAVVAVLVRARR